MIDVSLLKDVCEMSVADFAKFGETVATPEGNYVFADRGASLLSFKSCLCICLENRRTMNNKVCDYCDLTRPDCKYPLVVEGDAEYSLPDGKKQKIRMKFTLTPKDDEHADVELIPFMCVNECKSLLAAYKH